MDDFRDLMYDMILESLEAYVESDELDIDDADMISEAAYDELFLELGTNKLTRYQMEQLGITDGTMSKNIKKADKRRKKEKEKTDRLFDTDKAKYWARVRKEPGMAEKVKKYKADQINKLSKKQLPAVLDKRGTDLAVYKDGDIIDTTGRELSSRPIRPLKAKHVAGALGAGLLATAGTAGAMHLKNASIIKKMGVSELKGLINNIKTDIDAIQSKSRISPRDKVELLKLNDKLKLCEKYLSKKAS